MPRTLASPNRRERADEDHRPCLLDAARPAGPAVGMRCRRRSSHPHAGRRIVGRAHKGVSDALSAEGAARPSAVVYTHSHWDHVLGGAELGGQVIAHASTADQLIELAARDWSDEGLDRPSPPGRASPEHAEHVKRELPAPRTVEVAPADIVFQDGIVIELGGVTVCVRLVGGDHSAESCVMYVEPDRVLFLGDCMYDSPGES